MKLLIFEHEATLEYQGGFAVITCDSEEEGLAMIREGYDEINFKEEREGWILRLTFYLPKEYTKKDIQLFDMYSK